jgi:pyruvate/2-oxoglutarate dehydrogenase complex dihydrolipoamide acyltransferase (E2) component
MAKRYGKVAVTAVGMFIRGEVWFILHCSATVLITLGSINQKVIEKDGKFVTREHLCITASFDHNIVGGASVARFMDQLTEKIKNGVGYARLLEITD